MIVLDPIKVTDSILVSTNVPPENPSLDMSAVYGPGERVNVDSHDVHDVYQQLLGGSKSVSLSIGNPCVVSLISHGLTVGQPIKFLTNGQLPIGVSVGATYFIISTTADSFQFSGTIGGTAIATSGSQSGGHTLVWNQIGKPISNETYWVKVGVQNAYQMFDEVNNTNTEFQEYITVSLRPNRLCGGVYLGGVFGDEVIISADVPGIGRVHQETKTLIQPTSNSSYFGWAFNRIRRRNYFLSLELPRFLGMVITITIRKPGGVAKCGMCSVGPITTIGAPMYGVGVEDKDYSSTRFDIDGASDTTVRGFSKILTLDVQIDNEQIGAVTEILRGFRQRNAVYIGASQFGHTVVFGKYESLKSVMPNNSYSTMAMKINGVI